MVKDISMGRLRYICCLIFFLFAGCSYSTTPTEDPSHRTRFPTSTQASSISTESVEYPSQTAFPPTATWMSPSSIPSLITTPNQTPARAVTSNLTYTPTASPTSFPITLLSPGQYLVYQTSYFYEYGGWVTNLGVISLDGVFQGYLTEVDNDWVRLSPDLKWLAFVYRKKSQTQPYLEPHLLNLQTGELTPFPSPEDDCIQPSWSPDGKYIAISCEPLGEVGDEIFITSIDTGSSVQLTNCAETLDSCGVPTWSPDGKWLAYDRRATYSGSSERNGLHIIDLSCLSDPSTCVSMDHGPFDAYLHYTWSPDSLFIAGTFNESIRVFGLESNSFRQVAQIDKAYFLDQDSITWSPDGEWIAYSTGRQVYLISPDGENKKLLFDAINIVALEWIVVP